MRHQGRIDTWQDDRGFGFIAPDKDRQRVFVHIKAFSNRRRRPAVGDTVTYFVKRDADGRLQAAQVDFANASQQVAPTPPQIFALVLAVAALTGVGLAVVQGELPVLVLLVYAGASPVAFLAYALDKSAARRSRWRVNEKTLHLLGVVGGWPGALVAQQWLRHKSRKMRFQVTFWVTVILNFIALSWIHLVSMG